MAISGLVREWHADEGGRVIDSEETPGGCWSHFSSVLVPGYRALKAGQSVTLDYQRAEQDGYFFRATEVWPAGQAPHRRGSETKKASRAYRSRLTITSDHPEQPTHLGPPGS
jgi:CspA family cold shock protein